MRIKWFSDGIGEWGYVRVCMRALLCTYRIQESRKELFLAWPGHYRLHRNEH